MNAAFPAAPPVSLGEATRVFARIGLLSFGGPAGQIALMHHVLVEERRWIDEARFLHALNYCMLLPGPEAMQLATYVGWLLHGVRGGLIAGLLFVLPGAVVIMALSAAYLLVGDMPLVQGLLFGLKAAVLAVVLEALIRVSKRALKGLSMVALAIAAFVAIAFLKLPFPAIIVGAALCGVVLHLAKAGGDASNADVRAPAPVPEWTQPNARRLVVTVAVWLAIWLMPLAALHLLLGVSMSFGRGGVLLENGGCHLRRRLCSAVPTSPSRPSRSIAGCSPTRCSTGLGLAETTPGPLILVLVFVGFLGGARHAGLDPLTGGIAGALVTLWFTFVPCFLWIFAGAPYVETVRSVRWLATALAAVTAAVVGVIANLRLWFALHVLFGVVGETAVGPLRVPIPDVSTFDLAAVVIAFAAGVALIRFKANLFAVLAAAMAAGMALRGF